MKYKIHILEKRGLTLFSLCGYILEPSFWYKKSYRGKMANCGRCLKSKKSK